MSTQGVRSAMRQAAYLPQSNPPQEPDVRAALVRMMPTLDGRIEGSITLVNAANATLNSTGVITSDLFVPGAPRLQLNGTPAAFNGIVTGTGSAQPTSHIITLNSGSKLRHLVTQTDPVSLPSVVAPPAPAGTRSVTLDKAGQSPGDFATLRNLTLNSGVGKIAVPPGTYGSFTANTGSGFVLGVAGSTDAAIYNFSTLQLNSGSTLDIVGPVTVTLGSGRDINAQAGVQSHPEWLVIRVASGSFAINSSNTVYGSITAPSSAVTINSGCRVIGFVTCDRLTVNSNGKLQSKITDTTAPEINLTSPCVGAVTTASQISVSGSFNDLSATTVKVNGVTVVSNGTSFSTTVSLSTGANTISIIATDAFNNSKEVTRVVTRQSGPNQPPSVNAGSDVVVTLPASASLNGTITDDGLPTCAGVTASWTKVSGPGAVTFANASAAATTASFSAAGNYVLRLTGSDTELSASDDVSVTVVSSNQRPVVNAGADQTITLPNSANLNGSATDDGLPVGSTLSVLWSKVSGPGNVTFANPNAAATTASFSAAGSYILRLTASDSQLETSDDVAITVNAANQAPVANAGPDQTITLPNSANLNGSATDDGLPAGSSLTITWSKVSGPGTVTFANPSAAVTAATFGTAGSYVLKLTASDSQLQSTDDVTITVNAANQAPVVNAGSDQSITLPNSANLNGSATDDGLPAGSNLTITWSKVSGLGTVTFANPNAAATTASFSAAGSYVLQLTASDSQLEATDDVTITVSASNQAPVVNAGADQKITLVNHGAGETVTLVPISTPFNEAVGVDYHHPSNKLVLSVNYPFGQPHNFNLAGQDGTQSRFSSASGFTDEVKVATAREDGDGKSIGGFPAGETFSGTGRPGVIVRISADGSLVQNPWVTLPGESGIFRGTLYVDRTGVFGGDLIASTTAGNVWRINSAGQATLVAHLNGNIEGLTTVPNNPDRYGPWAGKILAGSEVANKIFAIAPDGQLTEYDLGIETEDIDVIPANENLFALDFGSRKLMGVPASQFASMAGDILITQEPAGILWRVQWTGSEFKASKIAQAAEWEHVTFAPTGIGEVPPVAATATLTATVSDDGRPAGASLSYKWSKVSGPGDVVFSDPAAASTSVTIGDSGVYILRLTVSDTEETSSDDVKVEVVGPNRPPLVDPGSPQTLVLPANTVTLNGAVRDDGLPEGSNVTTTWSKVSGPGDVTFTSANQQVTQASFSAAGDYVLRLTASDGDLTRSSEVAVKVTTPCVETAASTVTWWTGDATAADVVGANNGTMQGGATFASGKVGQAFSFNGNSAYVQLPALSLGPKYTIDFWMYPQSNPFFESLVANHERSTAFGALYMRGDHLEYWQSNVLRAQTAFGSIVLNRWSHVALSHDGSVTMLYINGQLAATSRDSFSAVFSDAVRLGDSMPPHVVGFYNGLLDEVSFYNDALGGATIEAIYNADAQGKCKGTPRVNQAPAVNAGADQAVTFPSAATLNGTVSDDGLPTGGTLTSIWSQVSGPAAVTFASPTSTTTTVNFSAAGVYVLRLTASDSQLTSSDDVTITVSAANQPPVVNAGPDQTITLPQNQVSLNGSVTDDGLPAGGTLTTLWSVVSGPGGVTFGDATRPATTASFAVEGVYVLKLTASDSALQESDEISITVNPAPVNQPPTVSAGPDQAITQPADAVTLNGSATDDGLPSGSTLALTWSKASGPGNVTFANPSSASTTATITQAGTYVLRLIASDSQLTASDDVTVVVNAANQAPVVNAGADQTITLPAAATLNGTASDDGLPAGSTLVVNWSKVSGSGSITFSNPASASTTATFSAGGSYLLRLTATDSALTTSDDVTIIVIDPANAPPAVDITSPADGSDVTSPASVTGTVDKGTWRLEYSLNSEDGTVATQTWTEIVSGTAPVSGLLGKFDPTLLLNGIYSIRLSSTDTASGQTSSDTISVVVSKNLKIGNFTLAFNDLSVPVAGLPIQIIRSYDSRDKREGDFGVGWTLGIKNVRLEKSAPLGRFWQETQSGAIIPQFCLEPTRPHLVTITFPDNRVYKFRAVTSPQCQAIDAIRFAALTFTQLPSDPGLQGATLTPVGGGDIAVDGTVPGIVNFIDTNTLSLYNPTVFELRTAEGFVFIIDQRLGVTRMTDPNGNTLTINSNGIIHSSGKSVVFTRDTEGRITRITDPNGNAMIYSYDANGDLISFKDRENNETRFSYDNRHGLLTITDPRGIQPIRNDYDADGRLIKHTDAFGKEIVYTHDLGNRIETITDRLGHETTYEYDLNGNVVRTIDPFGNVTQYTYDARDNKATETNAIGKTTTFTYDAADNVLTQTDPLGNVTRFTYNERREVLTVTDPRGGVTTNTYDTRGNLLTTRDALGNITTNTYDLKGLLRTTTDALNNVTQFDYDFADNLFKQTDALGHETTFGYDTNGNRISQTTTRTIAGGAIETLVTSFEYDKLNRLTKTTQPDGSTTRVEYNTIGQQSATIDQLGRRTSFDYDEMGRLTKTTYPDSAIESSTYDAEGRRLTSTDRASRVTTFTYDELGRLISTTYTDNTITSTSYDAISRVRTTTDARSNSTHYEYDDANRRTKVIDALNNETRFTYDANGNQASLTDARGNTTSFEYDSLNRRTRVVYADSTTDVTAYDLLGRVVSKTDQAGKQTRYGFDPLSRLTSVTDALNQITRYSYDELGSQITQTDANNHTTSFEYDKLSRRTKRSLPLGQTETYSYNAAGNLTNKTDFNSKTTTFSYDLLNRLLSKTPDPSFASLGAIFAAPITFTYTVTGRRASMTDPSGTTTYSYDTRDRLITKATPQGTLNYSYDAAGNLKSMRSSNENGVSVSYNYDSLNRLASVTDEAPANPSVTNPRPATGITTYSYDPAGNLAGYIYPNGITTSYNYNTLNRLTSMSIAKAATPLSSFTYTLGPTGNRLSVTELSGRTVNYGYDELYRLTSETISNDPNASGNGQINYIYDPVGSRLTRTSTLAAIPSTTHSYDANDRLTSDGYDANGNTIASGNNTYGFDFENRIISLTTPNSPLVTFAYDGDGNRVAKTANGAMTRLLVDDLNPIGYAQVVEEIVSSNVQRVYTHGHSLISQNQLISGNWRISFCGLDGHGSVRFLTDLSGTITDSYTFDAFGNLIDSTGSTANQYLYSGEQLDLNLGLYYLRARYLNPSNGRFWTMDRFRGFRSSPLSAAGYLYAQADPINNVDPSGLVTVLEQVGVAAKANIIVSIAGLAALNVLVRVAPIAREPNRYPDIDYDIERSTPPTAPPGEDEDDRENTVFRVLRHDENPALGIIAKDPLANETVRRHVRFGSRPNFRSQYISTTKSIFVAQKRAVTDLNRIAVIDLRQVYNQIIDLTNPLVRQAYGLNRIETNFAAASEEVLVVRYIPRNAIKMVYDYTGRTIFP